MKCGICGLETKNGDFLIQREENFCHQSCSQTSYQKNDDIENPYQCYKCKGNIGYETFISVKNDFTGTRFFHVKCIEDQKLYIRGDCERNFVLRSKSHTLSLINTVTLVSFFIAYLFKK